MKQSSYKIKSIPSLLPLWGTGGFSLHCVAGLLGALLLWLFPLWLSAQTTGTNYIVSTVPFQAVSDPTTLVDANSNTAIQYFDGLGRPIQTVQRGITPLGADLVTGIMYDSYGRDSLKWLPAVAGGNNGAYYPNFATQAVSSNGDDKPYSRTEYEPSPLNRVTGQYGAGNDWYAAGKKQSIEYLANNGDIACYYVNSAKQLAKDGNYAAGSLYVTKATDEDGKVGYEFKDKLGRVILKRQMLSGDNVDTYYVYNDLGQLCYVLPPKAVDELNDLSDDNAVMKQYCYLYQYDARGNCNYKRLPGCEPILMVYDRANRQILSQDGNQRAKTPAQWTVMKYDVLGRLIYTGLTNSITSNQTDLISSYKDDLIVETFSNGAYSNNKFSDATPLIVNYYDDYSFIPDGNTLTYDNSQEQNGYTPKHSSAKGLLTVTQTYHLNDSTKYETTAQYYDKYGRVVQTRSSNHMGGYDLVYNELRFIGAPTRTLKTHNIAGQPNVVELYTYTYDKAQRMLSTTLSLNGGSAVTLVSNTYDELGRLHSKNLGGVDATTYAYNVRGWTKDITGSKFTESLYYNNGSLNGANPRYNGNIAAMQWKVADDNLNYNRAYSFTYDDLNRLTNANYYGANISDGSVVNGTLGKYNETLDYQNDKMGNIHGINRNENGTQIESLGLQYMGNQLQKIDNGINHFINYGSELFKDSVNSNLQNEYAYDSNGNMLYDANGGVSAIQYNLLNLPDKIHFTVGHKNLYTYDASGHKLRTVNYSSARVLDIPMNTITSLSTTPSDYKVLTTDYIGNMIYENGALKEILLPEGYYHNGVFYYYLKDHLGNNRVTINSSGAVVEKSHYYPSGTRFFPESTSDSSALAYRYNGKEMETMNGLNQMDYGARRRFSWGSFWTAVDPLAEKYYSVSPYAYCHNNPINMIDPNGMGDYYTKNGIRLGSDGINDNLAYTASGVTKEDIKDEDGNVTGQKTTFNDSQKLSITNDDLNIYANTVAAESSGNKTESFAIASAISNISEYKGKDILKTIQSEGIYGYKDGGNSTNYKNNSKNGMAAAINALTGGTDYSGGALRWDGFDLAAKGFNHIKARTAGIEISDNNFNAFKAAWPDKLIKAFSGGSYTGFSNNFNSGIHPATQGNNKGLVLYQATIVLGRTIFWGPKSNKSGL